MKKLSVFENVALLVMFQYNACKNTCYLFLKFLYFDIKLTLKYDLNSSRAISL